MRILLADDDAEDRSILAKDLRSLGHEVVEGTDGWRAWEAFDRRPTRVVVSDWMMPGLDGLDLCRRVRARKDTSYAYFILLTGSEAVPEHYQEAMDAGVDDFLGKDAGRDLLRHRLRVAERVLDLSNQVEHLEGFITVCMYCKRVRRDDAVYEQLESYVEAHSPARFSHGACPECIKSRFPEARLPPRREADAG